MVGREGRPDRGALQHGDARTLHAADQGPTFAVLPVEPLLVDGDLLGGLLVVLPAELAALVDEHDVGTRLGGCRGCCEARGAASRARGRRVTSSVSGSSADGVASSSRAGGWTSTVIPSRTGVMQASVLGRPSTTMAHSLHTPMPQNTPRGSPRPVVRQVRAPSCTSAEATVSLARASTGRPPQVSTTAGASSEIPSPATRTD